MPNTKDAENVPILSGDFVFFAREAFAFDQLREVVIAIRIVL
jgi:hypothetical protein